MGRVVRALSEADWWRLVRAIEGVPGIGALDGLSAWRDARSWSALLRARDAAAIWLMGGCGLRVGELVRLVRGDVWVCDRVVRVLVVRAEIAKGGRERWVPVSGMVGAAVGRLMAAMDARGLVEDERAVIGAGPVWSGASRRGLQLMCGRLGQVHLGRRLTPHMLRHTFAVRLRRRADLAVVQAALGHARLSSTAVYMGVEDSEVVSAVGALDGDAGVKA